MNYPCPIVSIKSIQKHPTNPKLWVVALNSGPISVQVICGSENDGSCHYFEGQLGIFIPDGAIVPDKLADEMWVKGMLAGKKRNRVKAKMRDGEMSDGLFYGSPSDKVISPSWDPAWKEGDDVREQIGVTFKE